MYVCTTHYISFFCFHHYYHYFYYYYYLFFFSFLFVILKSNFIIISHKVIRYQGSSGDTIAGITTPQLYYSV